jgi:NADP-dependent 3-hydroxy acid dehydrogenase YdfG
VNNAGVFYTSPLEFLDLEKTKQLFEVNVWGVIAMTQVRAVADHF